MPVWGKVALVVLGLALALWLVVAMAAILVTRALGAQPAVSPTRQATPARPETPTPPAVDATATGTPPSTVSLGDACGADAAAVPPLRVAPPPNASERELQALALIPAARRDLDDLDALPHYTISATIDLRSLAVFGTQTVVYTNTSVQLLREVYFALYANAPANAAQQSADRVLVNGRPAPSTLHERTFLEIRLPEPLAPRQAISISMDFTTTVARATSAGYGSNTYDNDLLTLASWYPILVVHDDGGWQTRQGPSYGDLVYSASALYTVQISAPSGFIVVASGVPYAATTTGDVTTQLFRAGPVRDFYLTGSRLYCRSSQLVGQTIINSYYLPQDAKVGRLVADVTAATMAALNQNVGVYPFNELDVVVAPLRNGVAGIEYPGVYVLADRLYQGRQSTLEFVAAHETAHQWWYSLVGNDQVLEPWLDEALTSYTASLYWEATYGAAYAASALRQVFEAPHETTVRSGRDMPVNLPAAAYGDAATYSAIVYTKGALFFHALRGAIGDDAFFRILREYYATYRYRIAAAADFMAVARAVAGQTAQDVYDAWIVGVRR